MRLTIEPASTPQWPPPRCRRGFVVRFCAGEAAIGRLDDGENLHSKRHRLLGLWPRAMPEADIAGR